MPKHEVPSDKDKVRRPLYSAGTGTCSFIDQGICWETEDGALVKYDAWRASSAFALGCVRGTVLASPSLWTHVAGYTATSAVTCLLVSVLAQRPELIHVERLREAVNYFSFFVAISLAIHVSVAVERWWELRNSLLGGLWCAIDDLTMVLAVEFPSREHRRLKTLVLRYCLLSVELMFMQVRHGDADLAELCRRQLLRDDERERLEKLPAQAEVIWVWVAGTFQRLSAAGKLQSHLSATLFRLCAKGRGAVSGVLAHVDTQLPFSYVHLVSVIVHMNSLMVAAKCGAVAAVAIRNLHRAETVSEPVSDAENTQVLLIQCFSAVAIPMVTLGLLQVAVMVSDPFGSTSQDFPQAAYHMWMRDECEAFQTTAEEAPAEITHVTDKVEIKGQGFVHDAVTVV